LLTTHFITEDERTYLDFDAPLVEVRAFVIIHRSKLIGETFLDSPDALDGKLMTAAFEPATDTDGTVLDHYRARVSSKSAFDLVIKMISRGLSFSQVEGVLEDVCENTQSAHLHKINRQKVQQLLDC
jgi:hypothetical protein